MNIKTNKSTKILALIAVVFIMLCAFIVNKKRDKITEATKLPFYNTNLAQVDDGTYTGKCYTSFAHVQLEIQVADHQFKEIKVLECDGLEAVKAKEIVNVMKQKNATVVPAIKGAEIGSMVFISAADDAITPDEAKGDEVKKAE